MKPVFVNGVVPGRRADALAACIRDVFLHAADNLSWLGDGDTVLLKPALNSPDPYPSTTHPPTHSRSGLSPNCWKNAEHTLL